MLLFGCMNVEKNYSFLLLCVPCQEITQDYTKSLLRKHLNYFMIMYILFGRMFGRMGSNSKLNQEEKYIYIFTI